MMPSRVAQSGTAAAVALAIVAAMSDGVVPVGAQLDAPVGIVVAEAAARVDTYLRDMQGIVLRESYQQIVRDDAVTRRRTSADLILLDVSGDGWLVPFRDVVAVDGEPVRRDDGRLARLFQSSPRSQVAAQARAISEESARYNLSAFGVAIPRTINTPVTALMFLTGAHLQRSTFELGEFEDVEGMRCRVLGFVENQVPSLIGSSDGTVQVRGRFWIEVGSGHVRRSEVVATTTRKGDRTRYVRAFITTTFANVQSAGAWLPVRMDEHYEIGRGPIKGAMDAQAVYSDARRFAVTTQEEVR